MTALNYLDLNGLRVTSCSVTIPLVGAWVADVELADDTPLAPGPQMLTLGDLTLIGVVVRDDAFAGARSVRLVAGAGGWGKEVPAQGYQSAGGVPTATPLVDLMLETLETIAPAELAAAVAVLGVDYVREAAPAVRTLEQLVGGTWWIDGLGITHIVPRVTGVPIVTDYLVEDYRGGPGRLTASTEDLASWLPGAVLDGPQLGAAVMLTDVTIRATDDGELRVEALVVPTSATAPTDSRILSALRAIIRQEARALTFAGVWEYQVAAASVDGAGRSTFDGLALAPGAPLPALRGVELRPGLPGAGGVPTPGARVLVAFVNADPARPVVVAYDSTPATSIGLCSLFDLAPVGTETGRVVRYGDKVQIAVSGVLAAGPILQQATTAPNPVSRVSA